MTSRQQFYEISVMT